jgi:3-deoxy-D-manno-octulosonate 8-phosphate phosphatase (KDO 8-P phosphatase)
MGDDLPDLPILSAVGLAICPADAVEAVKAQCHWVTTAVGGNAAMREAIELLIQAKQTKHPEDITIAQAKKHYLLS